MLDPIYNTVKTMNNGDVWPTFGSVHSFADWDSEWSNVAGPTFTDSPREETIKIENNIDNASFHASDDEEWRPINGMDDDADRSGDSISSGFAARERTSSLVYPISPSKSPSKSPRKALPISHYTMRASLSSPTKSPRRRVEHIKSTLASSSPKNMVIPAPPLTISDTTDDSHSKSAEEDIEDIGMTPMVPQQRRLSLWGKMVAPPGKRRHSIDRSIHKSAAPPPASPRRRGRRRLSFFGNKPEEAIMGPTTDNIKTSATITDVQPASPRRDTGRRRLSFFGNKPQEEIHIPKNDSLPSTEVENSNKGPVKAKRRLILFGRKSDIDEYDKEKDQHDAKFVQEENNDFKIISSIRRRLSLFNSGETEAQQSPVAEKERKKESKKATSRRHSIDGSMHSIIQTSRRLSFFGSGKDSTDDQTPHVQDINSENESNTETNVRRHSIDNSLHDASSPFRRRVSFFGSKIVYDERPDTKSKRPTTRKKAKKRSSTRRHSIDGSQHNHGKAKRRLSLFGSKSNGNTSESDTSKKERKRKKAKKSKSSGRRRHSIDGSLHR